MTKYDAFWNWFLEHEEDIYDNLEQTPDDIASEILIQLQAIHPDIVFDIPFEQVDNQYEFIISADGNQELFPIVKDLVDASPTMNRWIVHNLRPRTYQMDQAIELDGLYLEYEDIYYVLHSNTVPTDIDVYIRGYDKHDNRYVHGYFLLLDTLIGEYDAVMLLQNTFVYSWDDVPEQAKRLLLLREELDQKKKS